MSLSIIDNNAKNGIINSYAKGKSQNSSLPDRAKPIAKRFARKIIEPSPCLLGEETEKGSSPSLGAGESNKPSANDSQIKHIFRDAERHLPDTPANGSLVEGVGNNPKNYVGTDAHGTNWYTQIQPNGNQVWVRTYNGTITNAG